VQIFGRFVRPECVALFITPERATAQGRRGRVQEYAHAVRFPEACVSSEKFAKYVRVFRPNLGTHADFRIQFEVRLVSDFTHPSPLEALDVYTSVQNIHVGTSSPTIFQSIIFRGLFLFTLRNMYNTSRFRKHMKEPDCAENGCLLRAHTRS